MVAAEILQPQKEHITVELVHEFRGDFPEVPTLLDVNVEELTKPDKEAGLEPFYVTLALAHYNQRSQNNRIYSKDTAIRAIYDAIVNQKIGGNKGHTPEHLRSTFFEAPVLHWVGAKIVGEGENQVLWAKAYVPGDSERMREMRGYYRRQMATNSRVGTSLEGWGYQEYDEVEDTYIVTDLVVFRIDAVEGLQTGIPMAGMRPPKITSETQQPEPVQEAAPDEVAVGDLVSWNNRNNVLMRGRINTIWTEGEVEVPYSDSPPLMATAESPIARMDVYEPHYDTGEWRICGWQEVQYVRDLMKIESLPELATAEDALTENEDPDEQEMNIENLPEDNPMANKPSGTQENLDGDNAVAELKQSHQKETRELKLKISELEASMRNYNTMVEMLAIDGKKPDDPILALQALQTQLGNLQAENFDLLDTAIKQEVAEHVKVELVRPVVEGKVKDLKPARKSDVKRIVAEVLARPEIKTLLQYTVQQEMGPNVENPKTPQPDNPVTEQWIILPEVEGSK